MLAVYEVYQGALIHAKAGRYEAAAGLLRLVLAVWPDHGETWLLHGILAEAAGCFLDAYDSYGKAGELDSDRALVYRHHLVDRARVRASALEAEGKLGEAAHILGALSRIVPDCAGAILHMARRRLGDGAAEAPRAEHFGELRAWVIQSEMEAAQRLQADDADAASASLQRLVALGLDPPALVDGLRRAAAQLMDHAVALSLEKKRFERASALRQWQLKRDPGPSDPRLALDGVTQAMNQEAERLSAGGNRPAALALHRRALALAPGHASARQAVRRLIAAAAEETQAAIARADGLAGAGRLEEAVALYRAAIQASPHADEPRQRLWRARQAVAGAAVGRLVVPGVGPVAFEARADVTRLCPLGTTVKGDVLVSFFRRALLLDDEADDLYASSVIWESREIARIFLELGYRVDVIDMGGAAPKDAPAYGVVFAADGGLTRLPPAALRILHRTGSAPEFQNRREAERAQAFERRRGSPYQPKRVAADPAEVLASIELADHCILIGNEVTRATYAPEHRRKVTPMRVSASRLGSVKAPGDYVPKEREFLWYFGLGAVLKGLDLLLDVVARQDVWRLNVVGMVGHEPDFERAYDQELHRHPRIRLHGHLIGNSPDLAIVCRRSFCFVAPSASEGMSNAVATCLSLGLYPIISRETGVDLPEGCGLYLETCTEDAIGAAMARAHAMPEAELSKQIARLQAHAIEAYGRPAYARTMREHLRGWLGQRG
ncbi:MAG: glycosyltransferase family 4 protein [Proteobacteria bacterium]|nr:glycosyltransferase family 4 protein [Pseudomonadota bacterium]MBI3497210.1 glycosyltransferase family 4 protein [Pseudomonadota bacterium]